MIPNNYELRVLDGLHKGAAIRLLGESVLIGSDSSCDVILLDEGVLLEHVRLVWSSQLGWVNVTSPGSALSLPIQVGDAIVSVALRGSDWSIYDVTKIVESDNTVPIISEIEHISNSPVVSERSFLRRKKLPILVFFIFSFFQLVYWINTLYFSRVDMMPASPKPSVEYVKSQSLPTSAIKSMAPVASPRFVSAVVAAVSYLIMPDGSRLYIGDHVNGVYLVELSPGKVVWRGSELIEVVW